MFFNLLFIKRLKNILNLPHIYNVENSQQVAQELLKLLTTNKMKFITLDLKGLICKLASIRDYAHHPMLVTKA
jgi:hypothetical protein